MDAGREGPAGKPAAGKGGALLGAGTAAALVIVALIGYLLVGQKAETPEAPQPVTTLPPDSGTQAPAASTEAAAPEAEATTAPTAPDTATITAATETTAEPASAAVAEASSEAPAATSAETSPQTAADEDVASFDQLRATADGTITLAGRAEPGAKVEVLLDGQVIDTVTTLAGGSFASVALAGPSAAGRLLSVRVTGADGVARESRTSVIVEPGGDGAVVADAGGARVLADAGAVSGAMQEAPAQLGIDTFATAEGAEGGAISGRGAPAGSVIRAYLDGAEAGLTSPGADGAWSITLPQVAPGQHALRVDAIDAAGNVLARAETEFTKLAPPAAQPAPSGAGSQVQATATDGSGTPASETAASQTPAQTGAPVPPRLRRVEVVEGDTLWAIAGAAYGDPLLYVQVFKANAGQIRDPDRIYPGQVFELPQ